jgi:FkbM family methyltransferase
LNRPVDPAFGDDRSYVRKGTPAAIVYAGQFGQDAFLDRIVFRGLRGGFFVDVGAHDGEAFSNTVAFERLRDWRGLCVEPNPPVFEKLRRARRAECLQCCIALTEGEAAFLQLEGRSEMLSGMVDAYSAEHRERIAREARTDGSSRNIIKVPTLPLQSILAERAIIEVHLLSVDTEGGELEVLRSLDFNRVLVHAVTIENNYGDARIAQLLRDRGFVPIVRLAVDTIFVNRRSPFFSRRLLARCLGLRALARAERKLRKLRLLPPGTAKFPYKRPR